MVQLLLVQTCTSGMSDSRYTNISSSLVIRSPEHNMDGKSFISSCV